MSGVGGLNKGITSIARLRSAIKDLPRNLRQAVANEASGYLDIELRADFDAGRTVYNTPRPLGVSGQQLSLVKSRKTRDNIGFRSTGTIVRAELYTRYAKYLIGKYKILPQRLPVDWQAYLENLVREYREDWEREQAR